MYAARRVTSKNLEGFFQSFSGTSDGTVHLLYVTHVWDPQQRTLCTST